MSLEQRLSRGVASMFGGIWIEQAFGFVVFIALARLMGAETFGIGMMAMVVLIVAEILVRETLTEYLIQKGEPEDGDYDAVFWSLLGFGAALVLILVVSAPFIAALYGAPRVADLIRWGSPAVLIVALAGVPVARMRREMAFQALAARTIFGAAVGGVAGIAAALLGAGPWSLIIQRVMLAIATDGVIWLLAKWRPALRARGRHFAAVWRFGARMLGLRVTEVAAAQGPSYIIALILGPAALGLFTIAWRLVDTLAFLLIAPVRYVVLPTFASLRRSDGDAGALLRDIGAMASLVTFACFFGLAAIAEPVIEMLFGPSWRAAAPVLQILCTVGIYFTIERLHQAFCLAMGRAHDLFLLSLAETSVLLVFSVIAAPHGLQAVALALAAALLLAWPMRLVVLKRLTGQDMRAYGLSFVPPLLIAGAMAAIVYGARAMWADALSAPAAVVAGGALGCGLYAFLAWWFMPARLARVAAFLETARAGDAGKANVAGVRRGSDS